MNTAFELWCMPPPLPSGRNLFAQCMASAQTAIVDFLTLDRLVSSEECETWQQWIVDNAAGWPTAFGLRLVPAQLQRLAPLLDLENLGVLIVAGDDIAPEQAAVLARLRHRGMTLVKEYLLSHSGAADFQLFDRLVIRGYESGGISPDFSLRTLFDHARARAPKLPVMIQGVESPELAAVFLLLGARGFICDASLLFLPDALPAGIGAELRHPKEGCLRREPAGDRQARVHYLCAAGVMTPESLPLGPNLFLCGDLQPADAAELCALFRQTTNATLGRLLATETEALTALQGDPFLVQGPMAYISTSVQFAEQLAAASIFPVFASTGLDPDELSRLKRAVQASQSLSSFGIGIAGTPNFSPHDLQSWPDDRHPRSVVVASDQWPFRAQWKPCGAPLWLHIQNSAMLETAMEEGYSHLIVEGGESGGHVGYLPSTVLWALILRDLRDSGRAAASLHLILAGGVHEAPSILGGLLLARAYDFNGTISFQMGTPLLFCEEAVSSRALSRAYQDTLCKTDATVVLGSGTGSGLRAAAPPDLRRPWPFEAAPADAPSATLKTQLFTAYRDAVMGSGCGLPLAGEAIAHFAGPLSLTEFRRRLADCQAAWSRCRAQIAWTESLDFRIARKLPLYDLAVVGIGGIFPGANGIEAFWENVRANRRSIVEIPPAYWGPGNYREGHATESAAELRLETSYAWHAGMVTDFTFDKFDCLKFHITPKAVLVTDKIHLLLLKAVDQALMSAGTRFAFPAEDTAVLVGNSMGGEKVKLGALRTRLPDILALLAELPAMQELAPAARQRLCQQFVQRVDERLPNVTEDTLVGLASSTLGGRIAAYLNVLGGNFSTDAACASSLAALEVAVKLFETGSCRCVVVGGVDSDLSPDTFINFSRLRALAHGISRPFMEGSDGFTMGEGAGVIFIKPLDDALRDGDPIFARIVGVGMSSDGRMGSMTLPSLEGQLHALRRAFAASGFTPSSIGCIEAHGTGTPVGDAVELEALNRIFGRLRPRSLALGSVKAHIGHLKSAAGIASLLKAILALHHKTLPPTWIEGEIRSELRDPRTPFRLLPAARSWTREGFLPRRAAVSSFGFGGSNFHVHLEEMDEKLRHLTRSRLFLFSGANPADVQQRIAAWSSAVADSGIVDVFDVRQTRHLGGYGACRLAAIWEIDRPWTQFLEALRSAGSASSGGIGYVERCRRQRIAFLFPGQGSAIGAPFRHIVETVAAFTLDMQRMSQCVDGDLAAVLWPSADNADDPARFANPLLQPATTALSIALVRLLRRMGIMPDAVAGHSLGFYSALAAARVLGEEDAVRLVRQRAACFDALREGDAGDMLALFVDAHQAHALRERAPCPFYVANLNSPQQTVIALKHEGRDALERFLGSQAVKFQRLPVGWGFHSPLMTPAAEAFRAHLERLAFRSPLCAVYSETTAEAVAPAEFNGRYPEWLPRHITSPVQFAAMIQALSADGYRLFLEVGGRGSLSKFVKETLPPDAARCETLDSTTPDIVAHWHRMLALLYVAGGLPVDFGGYADVLAGHLRPVKIAAASGAPGMRSPTPAPAVADAPAPEALAPSTAAEGDSVYQDIRRIIALHSGFDESLISPSQVIQDTLGVDSLKMVEIGLAIEKNHKVNLASFALPHGLSVGQLADLVRRHAGSTAAPVAITAERHVVTLRAVPLPDQDVRRPRKIGLLTHNRRLAEMWRRRLAQPAQWFEPLSADAFEPALRQLPTAELDGLIYAADSRVIRARDAQLWEAIFEPAFHVGRTIMSDVLRRNGRFHFMTAALTGRAGDPAAALEGFMRSLQWEFPEMECRHITFHAPAAAELTVDTLWREVQDRHSPFLFVHYTRAQRWVEHLEPTAAGAGALPDLIGNSDVILATGGGRGITAAILRHVSQAATPTWIITGSTALQSGGQRADNVKITLETLEQAGCRVLYVACDFSQPDEVRALARRIGHDLPAVTGVIHGAGMLADSEMAAKNKVDFYRVLAVKAISAAILQEELDLAPLKFWINMSSMASVLGNRGQTDYAAANVFLNHQARHLRRAAGVRLAKSILWSAWRDIGMASGREIQNLLQARKIASIAPEDGLRYLTTELAAKEDPVVAYCADPLVSVPAAEFSQAPLWRRRQVAGARIALISRPFSTAEPFLRDHVINGIPVVPGVMALEWSLGAWPTVQPPFRWQDVRFRRILAPRDAAVTVRATWKVCGAAAATFIIADDVVPDAPVFEGRLAWGAAAPPLPDQPSSGSLIRAYSHSDLYGKQGSLFSGPLFQVLSGKVQVCRQGVSASLDSHSKPVYRQPDNETLTAQLPLAWIDGLFQMAALYCHALDQGTYLPTGIGRLWYRGVPSKRHPVRAWVWPVRSGRDSVQCAFNGLILDGRQPVLMLQQCLMTQTSATISR